MLYITRPAYYCLQCCGAETICFRSGSDFQKVSALAPALAITLELPVITDFILKSTLFVFFMKENRRNSHARSYSIWIFIFTNYFSWPRQEPEPKLRYSGSGSSQKFRLFAAPAHNTDCLSIGCHRGLLPKQTGGLYGTNFSNWGRRRQDTTSIPNCSQNLWEF